MKRLTKRYSNGTVTLDAAPYNMAQEPADIAIRNCEPIAAAVKRLAEYEDAEEQRMNSIELKPCPFCGGKGYIHTFGTTTGEQEYIYTV